MKTAAMMQPCWQRKWLCRAGQGCVLADLRRKGLMAIDQAYGDAWVRLTTRGKRLVQRIWPEAQAIVY